MAKGPSPTARSLAYLRAKGYTAGIVERWIAPARRHIDLGGFIDIIAWHPNHGILAIQTTSSDHVAHRLQKILQLPDASLWLSSGGRILIHGWGKRGKQGSRKLWTLTTEREVTPADFCAPVPPNSQE